MLENQRAPLDGMLLMGDPKQTNCLQCDCRQRSNTISKELLSVPWSIESNCTEKSEAAVGFHVKIIIRGKNYRFVMFVQWSLGLGWGIVGATRMQIFNNKRHPLLKIWGLQESLFTSSSNVKLSYWY